MLAHDLRAARVGDGRHAQAGVISIHAPSCEGATRPVLVTGVLQAISIHAPSCEGATYNRDS